MKKLLLLPLWLCVMAGTLQAQLIDRIVAVIGEEFVLQSDVDNQVNYMIINGEKDNGTLRCQVMENLIISKLLLNKAEQDSLTVSEAEVAGEVERRVAYILSQMNDNEREFVRIYGKPVAQFKEDIRPEIEDELLIDRQRQAVESESSITPKEVKDFFSKIPIDSLGLLPAEVQFNHIVIVPPFSKESKRQALETLKDLRNQVAEGGADFSALAAKNSDEPGARESKGRLPQFGRGQMVPEFEEVVYSMREGEVSEPFETEFGYHIVLLHKRQGELLEASHILKIPQRSTNGDSIAIDSLNKIRELITTDSLTFEQAAIRFSADRQTKDCGGCYVNPQTQELRIPMDALPADMYFKIDEMQSGEISKPMEHMLQDRTRSFHLVLLKSKIPPHKPNLKDDYEKIRRAALSNKQMINFEKWLDAAKKNIYIDVKPTECSNALQNWVE
jgi:peptidyl-prolyl cis-trans isomerase SurA